MNDVFESCMDDDARYLCNFYNFFIFPFYILTK